MRETGRTIAISKELQQFRTDVSLCESSIKTGSPCHGNLWLNCVLVLVLAT